MVKKASLWKRILANTYVWLLLLLMYLPVLVLIIYSFNTSTGLFRWDHFSFDLYKQLFNDKEVMKALGNTLIIAFISATIATLLGSIGAIGVFESRKWVKRSMEFSTQIPVVTPEIVLALSLIILFVFAGNYIFKGLELSFWTLLIGHLVLTTPFVYLSVKPKLVQMDPALYEAALDLGCTPTKAMRKVLIPEIMPGVMSGFLLSVSLSLDDFIVTAFTRGPGLLSGSAQIQTLSTYVQGIIKKHPLPPYLRALTTVIFLAVLIVVIAITVYNNVKAKKSKKRKGRAY